MPAWRCALAVLYLDGGREAQARRELEHLAAGGFADFPRDNVWMVAMSLLAELPAGPRRGARSAQAEKLLQPFAARNVVSPEGIFGGPVARLPGAVRRRARRLGRGARAHGGRARGGRAPVAGPD